MQRTEIVVGYDGSAPSRTALRYAVSQARQRNAAVRILMVFDYNWRGARFGGVEELESSVRQRVRQTVDEAVDEARAEAPDVDVSGTARVGSPGPVLVEASHTAAMVVVGNRGHGGFAGLMLGSVGQYVAARAECPVLVVRGKADTADGPVVVGADGSDHGEHTLAVAFEEAARRRTRLVAIRVYHLPISYGLMAMGTLPYDPADLERAESAAMVESMRSWRDKYPDVELVTRVTEGSPAGVLVDLSSKAGLIVVGSHGHGALAGTLLGSTSLQVLHHADCPVLIVRQAR